LHNPDTRYEVIRLSPRKEAIRMPGWLWIFAGPLILVALFVAVAHIDHWLARFTPDTSLQQHSGASTGTLTVYLPGLLADGDDSSKPVIETWLKHGDVLTVSYNGEKFDANDVVKSVTQHLMSDTAHDQFVFVGSSMGGLLTADIMNELRREGKTDLIAASSV